MMGLGAFPEKLVGELSTGDAPHRRARLCAGPGARGPAPGRAVRRRRPARPRPWVRCLTRVQQHTGCSILVVEHDMPLLTAICNRMIALRAGRGHRRGHAEGGARAPGGHRVVLGADESTINRSGVHVAPPRRVPGRIGARARGPRVRPHQGPQVGAGAWLAGLPTLVAALKRDWSIHVGTGYTEPRRRRSWPRR